MYTFTKVVIRFRTFVKKSIGGRKFFRTVMAKEFFLRLSISVEYIRCESFVLLNLKAFQVLNSCLFLLQQNRGPTSPKQMSLTNTPRHSPKDGTPNGHSNKSELQSGENHREFTPVASDKGSLPSTPTRKDSPNLIQLDSLSKNTGKRSTFFSLHSLPSHTRFIA